jgi:hypothetical protein
MTLLSILERLGMFEDITADLYPYRFVITPLVIIAALSAGYLAYQRGLHNLLLRHRLATTVIGVPVLVIALVAGDYLLSPLWERSSLYEASPLAVAEAAAEPTAPPAQPTTATGGQASPTAGPAATPVTSGSTQSSGSSSAANPTPAPAAFQARIVRSGDFVGADDFHFGRGDAQLIETSPGRYVLRFENFSVRNGPDLYVYLSEDASGKNVSEALNLGRLKATDGAFNYEIPSSIDVSKVKSAVVWCKQFAVLFTHAQLM